MSDAPYSFIFGIKMVVAVTKLYCHSHRNNLVCQSADDRYTSIQEGKVPNLQLLSSYQIGKDDAKSKSRARDFVADRVARLIAPTWVGIYPG